MDPGKFSKIKARKLTPWVGKSATGIANVCRIQAQIHWLAWKQDCSLRTANEIPFLVSLATTLFRKEATITVTIQLGYCQHTLL